eukprot:IDg20950t1
MSSPGLYGTRLIRPYATARAANACAVGLPENQSHARAWSPKIFMNASAFAACQNAFKKR